MAINVNSDFMSLELNSIIMQVRSSASAHLLTPTTPGESLAARIPVHR